MPVAVGLAGRWKYLLALRPEKDKGVWESAGGIVAKLRTEENFATIPPSNQKAFVSYLSLYIVYNYHSEISKSKFPSVFNAMACRVPRGGLDNLYLKRFI